MTYGTPYGIVYSGGEKRMSKKKKHKKNKSNYDWLQQALLDLLIGIILLMIEHFIDHG